MHRRSRYLNELTRVLVDLTKTRMGHYVHYAGDHTDLDFLEAVCTPYPHHIRGKYIEQRRH